MEIRRPPARLTGTGFAVADGSYVVTNYRVVADGLDRHRKEYRVVLAVLGRSARAISVKTVAKDPDHDVAILKILEGRLKPLVLGTTESVVEGQTVAFTGLPIGAVLGLYPVTHQGIVSARTPIAVPQLSSRRLDSDERNSRQYAFHFAIPEKKLTP